VDGSVVNAIKHRCIRGSRPASTIAAAEGALNRARRTYRRLDTLIVPSRFMAGVLERGGLGARVRVLPNFFEADDASAGDRRHFLFVGRLDERKGVPILLDAFRRHDGSARLRLIGGGPLEPKIRSLGPEAGIDLLGVQNEAQVLQELAGAVALIVPSTSEENCPMTVLEARSQRTPVICSDRGGLPEVVTDGVDGLLFPAGDAHALAERLGTVAGQPELAKELAERGFERLRSDHSKQRYYEGLLEAYSEAKRGHGGSPPIRPRSRSTSGA
jgi:glycosyltransferase involved in cell wall biosynthesis